jgi:hypothetical protein
MKGYNPKTNEEGIVVRRRPHCDLLSVLLTVSPLQDSVRDAFSADTWMHQPAGECQIETLERLRDVVIGFIKSLVNFALVRVHISGVGEYAFKIDTKVTKDMRDDEGNPIFDPIFEEPEVSVYSTL